ncbi:MAG: protelomerase family protein, partial [Elainellaceae cyanobacterium]
YLERIAALEFLLGRRPTEVMKLKGFKLTGRYTIEFSGQLKKKDGDAKPYAIYALTEAHKIIAALDRLEREADLRELDGDTNKSIDSRRNSSANAAVRRVFGDVLSPPVGSKRLSNKNLRAAYVQAAATLFKPMQRSMSSFAEQVLGHDGVSSIINYEDYVCSSGDGKEMPHGQWGDRLEDEAQKPKSRKKTTITVDGQRLERFKGIGADDITHGERLDVLLNTHDDYQAAQREIERLRRELKAAQDGGGKPKVDETKVAKLEQKPQSELAADRTKEGSIVRMSRCVEAIKAWNKGKTASEMYSLSRANIRYLSGARNDAVKDYYAAHPDLEEYNQSHGFSSQHDRGKTPIKEVITDW